MKQKIFPWMRFGFLLIGLILLGGVLKTIGWADLKEQMLRLRAWFLLIFCLGAVWYACYTCAWRTLLSLLHCPFPWSRLFRIKIVGETINTMTPFNFLGGDPMRVYFLSQGEQVPAVAASVVVDRTVNLLAIVAVIAVGAAAAFVTLPNLPWPAAIGIALFLLGSVGTALFFLLKQQRGLFTALVRGFGRLPFLARWLQKQEPAARELDAKILQLYQTSPRAFWQAFGWHSLGRLLGIIEVFLIGVLLEPRFNLLHALLLATLAPVINLLFTFIPGALGVLEGAYSAALYLLGLDPALGLTIQLVKRMRSGFWMGLGLFFILSFPNRQRAAATEDRLHSPQQSFP